MENERLRLEKIVLSKYFKGLYKVEKTGKNDVRVDFQHGEFSYSIIGLKKYPQIPPLLQLAEETVLKLKADESFGHKMTDVTNRNGVFYLEDKLVDFNPSWTFYKIIGIVNEWLDNRSIVVEEADEEIDVTSIDEIIPTEEITPKNLNNEEI